MERIGLIAGGGRLPVIFAKEARKRGVKVIGFAIKEMASPDFDKACDRVHRLGIGHTKKFFFLLLAERIKKIAMLGKVDKSIIYSEVDKDKKALKALDEAKDKNDYSILEKITSEIEKTGVKVISGIEYLSDILPSKGVLTKREPSEKEQEDISFGLERAREIARLDIGQAIVVKDKAVVAVEALEGTDRAIERAAELCGPGFSVIKVSRPEQDMRWDVPVVGPKTISLIAEKKGAALALEEKKMFLLDKDTCAEMANLKGISIVVV